MWNIDVTGPVAGASPWPARVSLPLPKGSSVKGFSVTRPDGSVTATQFRELVRWPDGSPRWVQLDFQTGQAGRHVVRLESSSNPPQRPVRMQRDGETFRIDVGRLSVTLTGGKLTAIRWLGRDMLAADRSWSFVVSSADGRTYVLQPDGSPIHVEASGDHRFQASWTAKHVDSTGATLLEARMRMEMLAGVEGLRLDYQFMHKLPGHDFLDVASIDATFPIPGMLENDGRAVVLQLMHSNLGLHRYVRLKQEAPIQLDRSTFPPFVEDPAAVLNDQEAYPHFLRGHNDKVGEAVALENDFGAVIVAMRDFHCHRPKTLDVRPGGVDFGIWPRRAGTLRLPQGRSYRQQFSFRFTDGGADAVDTFLSSAARCNVEPAVAWLDRADSVAAGETWDQPRILTKDDPGATFFHSMLSNATFRWQSVVEMFNYGDIPDVGYTMSYPTISMPRSHAPPEGTTFSTYHVVHPFFHSYDHFDKVWTNNEYDIIYCLSLEAMRSKSLPVLEKVRSAARHQIEVDFVHYCDHWQQHRGTPAHSYNHTSGTAIIASHQWTQGLYYYYCLTGDDDVPEVVRAICDFNMMFIDRDDLAFSIYFNRELGWALIALVFGYELTGDVKYIKFAEKIIRVLQKHAERTDFDDLSKKTTGTTALNATGIGTGFNVNTIPLGVKFYYQATGDAWAKDVLVRWVDFGMTNHNNRALGVRVTELFPETFCYVSQLLNDDRYLRESTWHLRMFFRGFNSCGWMDPYEKNVDTKQFVRVYRAMIHQLSAMSRAGLLEAFEKELTGD